MKQLTSGEPPIVEAEYTVEDDTDTPTQPRPQPQPNHSSLQERLTSLAADTISSMGWAIAVIALAYLLLPMLWPWPIVLVVVALIALAWWRKFLSLLVTAVGLAVIGIILFFHYSGGRNDGGDKELTAGTTTTSSTPARASTRLQARDTVLHITVGDTAYVDLPEMWGLDVTDLSLAEYPAQYGSTGEKLSSGVLRQYFWVSGGATQVSIPVRIRPTAR